MRRLRIAHALQIDEFAVSYQAITSKFETHAKKWNRRRRRELLEVSGSTTRSTSSWDSIIACMLICPACLHCLLLEH